MMLKFLVVLAFAVVCSAIPPAHPYQVVFRSPRAVIPEEAQEVPQTSQASQEVLAPSVPANEEPNSPQTESKPDGSDLKSDSSLWWRSYYSPYPAVYSARYYARPRVYYSPRYSYWNSYW